MTQKTLQAHRIETTLTEGGRLILEKLPFSAGQAVEVIVLPKSSTDPTKSRYPLRGTPATYDRPFDPIAEEDWDALK